MAISLLFGCCQIETCVADLPAACAYLREMVGAVPVEQELAQQIAALMPGTGYDVDHLECGGAVFQVNQPARGMAFNGHESIHQAYLDRGGPCVTNLNFYVDDITHARDLLSAMGAAVHIEGPSSVAGALGDYGAVNTRPGGDQRPFLFMGTRHLIGFDLEIMEPNFLRFSEQSAQFPAFVEPRPAPAADLRLHRLVVVVPDLGATWEALQAIFAPASRSKPYALDESACGQSFRIALGGMELEYCQPSGDGEALAEHLERRGPGVASVVFGCPLADKRPHSDPRWHEDDGRAIGGTRHEPGRVFAQSRERVGFDIVLERPEVVPGGRQPSPKQR
jgi:hypothetical protein